MIDAVLGKFYKYIILVLMIFIFGYVFYANSLAGKLANAEKVKTKEVRYRKTTKSKPSLVNARKSGKKRTNPRKGSAK